MPKRKGEAAINRKLYELYPHVYNNKKMNSTTDLGTDLGVLLRHRRVSNGLSMDDCTIPEVLTKPTIIKLENNRGGNIESLLIYCRILKMRIELKAGI